MKLDKMMMVGALVAGMSMASSVMAGYQVQVGNASTYGTYSVNRAGEFTMTAMGGLEGIMGAYGAGEHNVSPFTHNSFQTFCLEENETVSRGAVYDVALNYAAIKGGAGGAVFDPMTGSTHDPISVGTAWLYSQFARGTLAGYNYAGSNFAQQQLRRTSADLLQKALWALENEIAAPSGNIFYNAALAHFAASGGAFKDAQPNLYHVKVLNLTSKTSKGATIYNQDVLFLGVADSGTTLALLGLAFSSLGMFGLRFRK